MLPVVGVLGYLGCDVYSVKSRFDRVIIVGCSICVDFVIWVGVSPCIMESPFVSDISKCSDCVCVIRVGGISVYGVFRDVEISQHKVRIA